MEGKNYIRFDWAMKRLLRNKSNKITAYNLQKDNNINNDLEYINGYYKGYAEGYAEGFAEGFAEGYAAGFAAGVNESRGKILKNMFAKGLSVSAIADLTGMSEEDVEKYK